MTEPVPILVMKDIRVSRGEAVVLEIPCLQIRESETLSLIGPNGAGKTTLLQTLSHLIRRFQGEIVFKGDRVTSNHSVFEYRRKLAMVFQEPLLFDTTVFENVASGLKIRGLGRAEIRTTVKECMHQFGIRHLSDRSARTLSGGEAQRASLARAFAIKPEVLLLDEPFASLDPPTRESLIEDLEVVLRQTRTTTILATHDRVEALRLSDRIAVMNRGKILQIGPPDEVMNRPVDEFVASFVGVETIIEGRVIRREAGTIIASISDHQVEAVGDFDLGEDVALCIRPENVTLVPHLSREVTSARNVFVGTIVKIIPMGLFYRVELDCGFPLVAYITRHSLEHLGLEMGKEVKASFKATAIHVVRRKGKGPMVNNSQ